MALEFLLFIGLVGKVLATQPVVMSTDSRRLADNETSMFNKIIMSSNLQLDPANNTKTDYHNNVDNLTYFEGDLNVTQEMFDVFYKTERSTRAIRRDRNMLWPEGTIYYAFHASVNAATRTMILGAMREIEQNTCFRFHPWMLNQADYIDFTGEGDRSVANAKESRCGGISAIT